jgi:NOL1/NOP2/fmu family ribosome biogenesis protein
MITSSKGLPDFTHTDSIPWDSSWPELANKDERHRVFSYLEGRFGIPEKLFDGYLLFKRKKSWLLMREAPQIYSASQLKVSKVGLKAFQRIGGFLKPTTRIIQIFGHTATKARLEIDERQLQRLLAAGELPFDLDLDNGYVILALRDNRVLGLGLFINGKVRSQIPRKELRKAML